MNTRDTLRHIFTVWNAIEEGSHIFTTLLGSSMLLVSFFFGDGAHVIMVGSNEVVKVDATYLSIVYHLI